MRETRDEQSNRGLSPVTKDAETDSDAQVRSLGAPSLTERASDLDRLGVRSALLMDQ
jgi:hypothetical protein